MTFINEGNRNYLEKLVNFEKMVSLQSGPATSHWNSFQLLFCSE